MKQQRIDPVLLHLQEGLAPTRTRTGTKTRTRTRSVATPGPALPAASPRSCTSLRRATHFPLLSFPNFSHCKQGRKGDVAGGKADPRHSRGCGTWVVHPANDPTATTFLWSRPEITPPLVFLWRSQTEQKKKKKKKQSRRKKQGTSSHICLS